MNKIIFDASAVLALLQEEKGREIAISHLPHAVLSTVNFSEVITVLVDSGMTAEEAQEITTSIIKHIIPFDESQGIIAASLRKTTRSLGLSFGDRACLSLAKQKNWPVLTADQAWIKLQGQIDVKLIR